MVLGTRYARVSKKKYCLKIISNPWFPSPARENILIVVYDTCVSSRMLHGVYHSFGIRQRLPGKTQFRMRSLYFLSHYLTIEIKKNIEYLIFLLLHYITFLIIISTTEFRENLDPDPNNNTYPQ